MFLFKKYFRGESLFEIIIAITVISIGTSAITLLITTAMQANALSKQFIIANNLATEGLEAVSNIRESNWIEFSNYEKECWNVVSSKLAADSVEVKDATDCETDTYKIGADYNPSDSTAHYFVPELNDYYGWKLTQKENALSANLASSNDDNYALWRNATTGIYTISSSGNEDTPFYRMVSIQEYDSSGTAVAPTDTDATYMNIVSTVEWKDKIGTVHTTKKTMRLYNHVSL